MNKKIIFYNTENNGRYEYEPSNEEEYTRIQREIEKNIAILFMRDISSREEIHLCKIGDEEPIGVTKKLIRLNKKIKPRYPNFSLDEYIEKYYDDRIELAIIENDKYRKKLEIKNMIKICMIPFLVGLALSLILKNF